MGHRRRAMRILVAAALASSIQPPGSAQEGTRAGRPGSSQGEGDGLRVVDRWKREAAEYQIRPRDRPEGVFTLKEDPVLRWTNPTRDTGDGITLLWLDGARPGAVACFYRVRWQGRLAEAHEFHSLAPSPITATLEGSTVWAPRGAGFVPTPIPGAPRPAASPAERLRQMQALAREFRATEEIDGRMTELRLLPRPLHRFEPGPEGTPDGALFAFVLTTDPEALLMIEAIPGADGPRWHHGLARMSDHRLRASRRDAVVWEAASIPGDKGLDNPYQVRWDVGPKPR